VGVNYIAVRGDLQSIGDIKVIDNETGREVVIIHDALDIVVR
jgi:hypothetical protein